jgi:hypothetical protein
MSGFSDKSAPKGVYIVNVNKNKQAAININKYLKNF